MKSDKILVVASVVKDKVTTKRNTLSGLASKFDPMGLISQSIFIGNMKHGDTCGLKKPWVKVIPLSVEKKWEKWKLDTLHKTEILRSILLRRFFYKQLHFWG